MAKGDIVRSVDLFYREGGSDKQYRVSLVEADDGYVVDYANGRRGSALKAGTKTPSPLPLAAAEKIYDKILKEKFAKGYSPGESGARFVGTGNENRVSGIRCQLPNEADPDHVDALIEDPDWAMQLKMDGDHRLLEVKNGEAFGINRNGLYVPLPEPIVMGSKLFKGNSIVDGEIIGEELHVFDILMFDGQDLRNRPLVSRLEVLDYLFQRGNDLEGYGVHMVRTSLTRESKRDLFDWAQANDREGVVFKHMASIYAPGRPNSGGDHLKFKFWNTATVRVANQNAKRSVGMEVLADGKWQHVGNVTIPANREIPAVGNLIEVRYLYAYEGGSLFQPTFLALRTDLDEDACQQSQLKYKPEEILTATGMRP